MTIRDLTCGDSLKRVPAESPRVPAKSALWVSTDLWMWWPTDPSFIARDCQINDRCYRRLDPEYFAWLKLRMHAVKAAADARRTSKESFDELRAPFNDVQHEAISMFGEETLVRAIRAHDPDQYRPPLPEQFERVSAPAAPQRPAESERLVRARRLVDEIRDRALALGWSEERLYFCEGYERYPTRPSYGVICYIGPHHRIGEVTRESIELIGPPPIETRTRFYNPDVDQPWVRRTGR
jgi:hypothetical protein